MSNPYSAPSLSGYNGSATPDTDTVTYSWALHKNEIGDPLKTYMDSLATSAAAAFALQGFNDVDVKTDNYTILEADQGKLLVQTGENKTFTLPAAGSVGPNFMVAVMTQGNQATLTPPALTIDGATSETVDGSTSKVLSGYGEWAILYTDGSSWRSLSGSKRRRWAEVLTSDFTHTDPLSTNFEDIFTGFTAQENHGYLCRAYLEVDSGGVAGADFRLDASNNSGVLQHYWRGRADSLISAGSPDYVIGSNTGGSNQFTVPAATAQSCQVYLENSFKPTNLTGVSVITVDCANDFADSSPIIVRKGSFLSVEEIEIG